MKTSGLAALAVLAFSLPGSAAAPASGLSYDCDVPADHFSEVSQAATLPVEVSGVVLPVNFSFGLKSPACGSTDSNGG